MRKTLRRPPAPRRKKLVDSKLPHGKRSSRSLRTWKVLRAKRRMQRIREMMAQQRTLIDQALEGTERS